MTLTSIAQYISDALAIALVVRLSLLGLHTVYRVFCAFVIVDVFSSFLFLFAKFAHGHHIDYRVLWMAVRPLAWLLTLWTVYALLDAMLANLPGILRASRKVLNRAFVVALAVALLTARPEYQASGLANSADPINRAVAVLLVLERVIFTAAVLVLLVMLAFILWFPVQMPRNLAIFSVGFVLFFAIGAVVFLLHTLWPPTAGPAIFDIATFALAACYAYWLAFINRAGETRPVRMGHSWGPAEQQRLIGELEAMNAALLRASRR